MLRLIGCSIGIVIGLLMLPASWNMLPSWHFPAFNGLLFFPAFCLAVAIHEIGHLVAGRVVGVDSGGIAIGGILLLKSGSNWTVRFDRQMMMGGFFKPLARGVNFRPSRYAWMIAGGPIASIALTAGCGLMSILHGSGEWDWIGSSGPQKSDGALLRMFMWHPDQTSAWTALLDISTEETNGVRLREWNAEVFERTLRVDPSFSEHPKCQLMASYRRHDEGQDRVASEHLENVLATWALGGKVWGHLVFLEGLRERRCLPAS